MLACFCSERTMEEEVKDEQMEKVEIAFNKFDLDEDGFLSWEEFEQVHLSSSGIMSWIKNISAGEEFGPGTSSQDFPFLQRGQYW